MSSLTLWRGGRGDDKRWLVVGEAAGLLRLHGERATSEAAEGARARGGAARGSGGDSVGQV